MKKGQKITIKGVVQGVGYRYYAFKLAEQYDIKGYALNHYNGTLEVIAITAGPNLKDFAEQLKHGPAHSRVDDMIVEDLSEIPEYLTFEIK